MSLVEHKEITELLTSCVEKTEDLVAQDGLNIEVGFVKLVVVRPGSLHVVVLDNRVVHLENLLVLHAHSLNVSRHRSS